MHVTEADNLAADMIVAIRHADHPLLGTRRMPSWVRGQFDWVGAAGLRHTTVCRNCSGSGRVGNVATMIAARRIICGPCHGAGRIQDATAHSAWTPIRVSVPSRVEGRLR